MWLKPRVNTTLSLRKKKKKFRGCLTFETENVMKT